MEFIDDMTEQTEKKEKEYLLPDGFGLSLEQVKNLINQQCGISIKNDDPIMCMVPILNAFLHEQQKMEEKYREALEKVFQQITGAFTEELDKRMQGNNTINIVQPSDKKQENPKLIIGLYLIIAIEAVALFLLSWMKF